MKDRERKRKEVEQLKAELERSPNVIVSSFSQLTVEQEYELRKQVRAAGGKYRVVKNRLAERAARGTPAEAALKNLSGPTSLAYTDKDPVALAKALVAYARANPLFSFRAGVVEGRVVSVADIAELATMPGKEELIGRLLFLLNAPAQRLATALGAVARNLAVVLDQAVQEKRFTALATEPGPPPGGLGGV